MHPPADGSLADKETRTPEVAAWTKRRNDQKKRINGTFTGKKADNMKLSPYYVT
jgi:hypothetical protein